MDNEDYPAFSLDTRHKWATKIEALDCRMVLEDLLAFKTGAMGHEVWTDSLESCYQTAITAFLHTDFKGFTVERPAPCGACGTMTVTHNTPPILSIFRPEFDVAFNEALNLEECVGAAWVINGKYSELIFHKHHNEYPLLTTPIMCEIKSYGRDREQFDARCGLPGWFMSFAREESAKRIEKPKTPITITVPDGPSWPTIDRSINDETR
jgi:hypothetical protein